MSIFPSYYQDSSVSFETTGVELELFDDAASEGCIDEQDNPHLERLAERYLDNYEDGELENEGFRTDLEELNFQTARRILNQQQLEIHKRMVDEGDNDTINIDDIHQGDDDMPYTTQRRLLPRHLHMLALGGPLGAGLLLSAGRSITTAGPLGAILGFMLTGLITFACIKSIGDMVTLYPSQGLPLLADRFLNTSLGITAGVLYWLLFAVAIPSELSAAAALLEVYPSMSQPSSALVAWLTLFILVIVFANLLSVDYYGELLYWCNLGNLLIVIGMIITMFVVCPGTRFWKTSEGYGAFRPYYDSYAGFQLPLKGEHHDNQIHGASGRFLQIYASMTLSVFAFVGSESVFVAAPEVKNPRKAVPSAMRRIAVRIGLCYMLGVISLGLAVPPFNTLGIEREGYGTGNLSHGVVPVDNTGVYKRSLVDLNIREIGTGSKGSDIAPLLKIHHGHEKATPANEQAPDNIPDRPSPKLHRNSTSTPNQILNPTFNSPWVVALSLAGYETAALAVNGIFVICAVVASASHLYSASRTLYAVSTRWERLRWFSTCTALGIPWVAVLFSALISLLSYLVVGYSTRHVFDWMLHWICTVGLILWIIMTAAFLRFHKCLKVRRVPFKYSFPQPYTAWFGMIGCCLLLCFTIFSVYISWDRRLFASNYSGIFLTIAIYLVARICTRDDRFIRVSEMDIYSGKRQMDLQVWDDDRVYNSWQNKMKRRIMEWF
ncbi:amino acid permease-domain-containing protein [Yarrowia lipolytica]|uniref:Amino acid permease-domain-containing protein n=1 Tax=Yarrowia lipolytica TaxID=4952 RepID=A0A371C3K5_YARLL|nr:amino acid permease-domain-containing protein [Yarrowia lipolytica]RDW31710.1 amino acid permease-domain-containing protein [Yarrowia lipolytica]RDW41397.1 amino acid permease-domain-containing protein [Yarrowia lipolytica]